MKNYNEEIQELFNKLTQPAPSNPIETDEDAIEALRNVFIHNGEGIMVPVLGIYRISRELDGKSPWEAVQAVFNACNKK